MKIFILLIISVVIMTVFNGCKKESAADNDKPVVVSTITIINDMVKQIAGDKVNAVSICGIGYDPHTYKSVPEDSRTIAGAEIVFVNGFGLEGWIDKLIKAAGENKKVYTVTDGIVPLKDESGHGDPDPHCWFDAELAKVYVRNILKALVELDPVNRTFYEDNAGRYYDELDEMHRWTREQINSIPSEKRILITSHDAFRYFGEAYGIKVLALQGISTEAKAQTKDVAELVKFIQSTNLPAVFIETSVNPKLLEQIASETGAVIGGTLYSDSIGEDGSPGDSYTGAFRVNVETIVKALKAD